MRRERPVPELRVRLYGPCLAYVGRMKRASTGLVVAIAAVSSFTSGCFWHDRSHDREVYVEPAHEHDDRVHREHIEAHHEERHDDHR
jgi:hypothetical protein